MPARLPHDLEQQLAHHLDALDRELGPGVPRDRVLAIGRYHAERLVAGAKITDHIPLLVYRCTRDELLYADHTVTPAAA